MNPKPSTSSVVSEDEIARRARHLWDERGRPSGSDVQIWLEAERQLRQERTLTPPVGVATKKSPRVPRNPASKDIDQEEVAERLADYGEPPRRSATSVDLT